jgi:hypothetical protein
MVSAEDLRQLQTELRLVGAERHELSLRIRTRQLVSHHDLERAVIGFAHRVRDHVLNAPPRCAPVLAAEHGIDPMALISGLDAILREFLTRIAASARQANGPLSRLD